MRIERVSDFRCPACGSALRLDDAAVHDGDVVSGRLVCVDAHSYPIEDSIPNFLDRASLSTAERVVQADYDRVAEDIYDVAMAWQFAAMHEDEERVRESMVDMLNVSPGTSVLEIGCGTGRDSMRLAKRLGPGGWMHMQDLSPMMVRTCQRRMSELRRAGVFSCETDYSVSNAMALPFPDDAFDAVFHFGGFNQFGDLKAAAAELTRVAVPGGRIVIGDEAVAPWLKGTEFDAIVTTNNPLFKANLPLESLPVGARDVVVRWVIGNCFYVIAYTKGDGPPPLNLDLPHRGWRGGSMRTRYFGVLEGVSVEAKAAARAAAARASVSVHEWLDRLIKEKSTEAVDPDSRKQE